MATANASPTSALTDGGADSSKKAALQLVAFHALSQQIYWT